MGAPRGGGGLSLPLALLLCGLGMAGTAGGSGTGAGAGPCGAATQHRVPGLLLPRGGEAGGQDPAAARAAGPLLWGLRGGRSSARETGGDSSFRQLAGMDDEELEELENELFDTEEAAEARADGGLDFVDEDSEFERDYYDAFERVLNSKGSGPPPKAKRRADGTLRDVDPRQSMVDFLDDHDALDIAGQLSDDSSDPPPPRPRTAEDVEEGIQRRILERQYGERGGAEDDEELREAAAAQYEGAGAGEGEEGGAGGGAEADADDLLDSDAPDAEQIHKVWSGIMGEVKKHKEKRSLAQAAGGSVAGYGTLADALGKRTYDGQPKMSDSDDSSTGPREGDIDADEDDFFSEGELLREDRETIAELKSLSQRDLDATLRETCRHIPEWIVLPEDHVRSVMQCIVAGANYKNITDLYGWTLLHHAAFQGHSRVVRKLVKLGCDMEAVNKDGYTPLLCAARYGRRETCVLLIELGANYKHCSKDGETALDKAKRSGHVGLTAVVYKLFNQLDEEEMIGGRTAAEVKDDIYTEKLSLRYIDDLGMWQTLTNNATDIPPQQRDREMWRPLGWSYKDLDAMNRYEKDLPGWKEAQEDSSDEYVDLSDMEQGTVY